MGGGLNFLNKKTWHPARPQNLEEVWKREQKAAAEAKKAEELRKQLEEERKRSEFVQMAMDTGHLRKEERLDWMYGSGLQAKQDAEKRREDMLTGKADVVLAPEQRVEETSRAEQVALLPSFYASATPASQNETWLRLNNDPLFAIKRQQQEQLSKLRENPVKMMELLKSLSKAKEKEDKKGKEDKKEKKSKKEKKDKKSRKRERGSSDSSEGEEEGEGRRHKRSRSPPAAPPPPRYGGPEEHDRAPPSARNRHGGDAEYCDAPAGDRAGPPEHHRQHLPHHQDRDRDRDADRRAGEDRGDGRYDQREARRRGDDDYGHDGRGGGARGYDGDRGYDRGRDGSGPSYGREEDHRGGRDAQHGRDRDRDWDRDGDRAGGRAGPRSGDAGRRDEERRGAAREEERERGREERGREREQEYERSGREERRANHRDGGDASPGRRHEERQLDERYGLKHSSAAPEDLRRADGSSRAAETRARLEEARRLREEEERAKAAQRYVRKDFKTGQLSEEERQRRLAEMLGNAEEHEAQRQRRLEVAAAADTAEDGARLVNQANASRGGDAFREAASKEVFAKLHGSLEARVSSRRHFSSR